MIQSSLWYETSHSVTLAPLFNGSVLDAGFHIALQDSEQHHCKVTTAGCSSFCNYDRLLVHGQTHPEMMHYSLLPHILAWAPCLCQVGSSTKGLGTKLRPFSPFASFQIFTCSRSFLHTLLAKCIYGLKPNCLRSFLNIMVQCSYEFHTNKNLVSSMFFFAAIRQPPHTLQQQQILLLSTGMVV